MNNFNVNNFEFQKYLDNLGGGFAGTNSLFKARCSREELDNYFSNVSPLIYYYICRAFMDDQNYSYDQAVKDLANILVVIPCHTANNRCLPIYEMESYFIMGDPNQSTYLMFEDIIDYIIHKHIPGNYVPLVDHMKFYFTVLNAIKVLAKTAYESSSILFPETIKSWLDALEVIND